MSAQQVVDLFDALKGALSKRPAPTPAAEPTHIVFHGAMLQGASRFASFPAALECFREHFPNRPERAVLLGVTFDAEQDGLTDEEREAIECVEESVIARGEA